MRVKRMLAKIEEALEKKDAKLLVTMAQLTGRELVKKKPKNLEEFWTGLAEMELRLNGTLKEDGRVYFLLLANVVFSAKEYLRRIPRKEVALKTNGLLKNFDLRDLLPALCHIYSSPMSIPELQSMMRFGTSAESLISSLKAADMVEKFGLKERYELTPKGFRFMKNLKKKTQLEQKDKAGEEDACETQDRRAI